MTYCPNCGALVKAGERYCFGCGTKIVPAGEPAGQNAGLNSPEYCEGCPENNTISDDGRLRTPGFGSNEPEQEGYERESMAGTDESEIGYAQDRTGRRREHDELQERSRREGMTRDYDSEERYRRGDEMVQGQPLAPPAGIPQQQTPGQVPVQQVPVMVQVPDKPKRSFLSVIAKILEIIVYLAFIGAAVAGIYLLYTFAESAFLGIPGV